MDNGNDPTNNDKSPTNDQNLADGKKPENGKLEIQDELDNKNNEESSDENDEILDFDFVNGDSSDGETDLPEDIDFDFDLEQDDNSDFTLDFPADEEFDLNFDQEDTPVSTPEEINISTEQNLAGDFADSSQTPEPSETNSASESSGAFPSPTPDSEDETDESNHQQKNKLLALLNSIDDEEEISAEVSNNTESNHDEPEDDVEVDDEKPDEPEDDVEVDDEKSDEPEDDVEVDDEKSDEPEDEVDIEVDDEEIVELDDDMLLEIDEDDDEVTPEPAKSKPPAPPKPPTPPKPPAPPKSPAKAKEPVPQIDYQEIPEPDQVYTLPFTNHLKDFIAGFKENIASNRWKFYTDYYETNNNNSDNKILSFYFFDKGQRLEQKGKNTSALNSYIKALDLNNRLKSNLWALQRQLHKKGLHPKIATLLQIESDKENDPGKKAVALYFKAVEEELSGNLQAAAEDYLEVAELDENFLSAYFALIRVNEIQGHNHQAATYTRVVMDKVEDANFKSALELYSIFLEKEQGLGFEELQAQLMTALGTWVAYSQEIWDLLDSLVINTGNKELQLELKKSRCNWYFDVEQEEKALLEALDISIFLEKENGDTVAAFNYLDDILHDSDNKIIKERLADLAWKNSDYEWLSQHSPAGFLKYFSKIRLEETQIQPSSEDLQEQLLHEYLQHEFTGYDNLETFFSTKQIEAFKLLLAFKFRSTGKDYQELTNSLASDQNIFSEKILFIYWEKILQKEYKLAADYLISVFSDLDEELQSFAAKEIAFLLIFLDQHSSFLQFYNDNSKLFASDQTVALLGALVAEYAGNQTQAAQKFQQLANIVGNETDQVILALQAAKIHFFTDQKQKVVSTIGNYSHNPVIQACLELCARLGLEGTKLTEILQTKADSGNPQACFELAIRNKEKDPEKAADLLANLDLPEARWQLLDLALNNKDLASFASIFPEAVNDYQEDEAPLYLWAGQIMENHFQEDGTEYYIAAARHDHGSYLAWHYLTQKSLVEESELELPQVIEAMSAEERVNLLVETLLHNQDEEQFNQLLSTFSLEEKYLDFLNLVLRYNALSNNENDKYLDVLPLGMGLGEGLGRRELIIWLEALKHNQEFEDSLENPFIESFMKPWKTLTANLVELLPDQVVSEHFASLVSLNKEFKNKYNKAVKARVMEKEDDYLPCCLQFARILRTIDNNEKAAIYCAKIVDELPPGHPRQKDELLFILEHNPAPEMELKVLYQLWKNFPDVPGSAAKLAGVLPAINHETTVKLVLSLINHEFSDEELLEILQNLELEISSAEMDTYIALDEQDYPPLLHPKTNLLEQKPVLPEIDNNDWPDIPKEICTNDARLLSQIGSDKAKEAYIIEAARLYLIADNFDQAQTCLYDLETDSVFKAQLLLAIALNNNDLESALENANLLGASEGGYYLMLGAELSQLMSRQPLELIVEKSPQYAVELFFDFYARTTQVDQLKDFYRENQAKLTNEHKLIQLFLTNQTQLPDNLLAELKDSEFGDLALIREISLAQPESGSIISFDLINDINQRTPLLWSILEAVQHSDYNQQLPLDPVVRMMAFSQGKIKPQQVVETLSSPQLKARLLMSSVLEGDFDVEIQALAPESLENEIKWKLKLEQMSADDKIAFLRENPLNSLSCWWFNTEMPAEIESDSTINILQEYQSLTQSDYSYEQPLGPEISNSDLKFAQALKLFTLLKNKASDPDSSFHRANRLALIQNNQMEDLLSLVQLELESASPQSPIHYLDLMISSEPHLGESNWIADAILQEIQGELPYQVWHKVIENNDDRVGLLAFRSSLIQEFLDQEPAEQFLEKCPEQLAEKIEFRQANKNKNRDKLISLLKKENFQTELDPNLLIILQLVHDEFVHFKPQDKKPTLLEQNLLWHFKKWPELNHYLLEMTEEATADQKSQLYRQMIRIDEYGKLDQDGEYLTRETLLELDPLNYYNLLRLNHYYRLNQRTSKEIPLFKKLISNSELPQLDPQIISELFRLELLEGYPLPSEEQIIAQLQKQPDSGYILKWAFLVLGSKIPWELLGTYFENDQNSLFSCKMQHIHQLLRSSSNLQEIMDTILRTTELCNQYLPLNESGTALSLNLKKADYFGGFLLARTKQFKLDPKLYLALYICGAALETWENNSQKALDYYIDSCRNHPGFKDAFLKAYQIATKLDDSKSQLELLQMQLEHEEKTNFKLRYLFDLANHCLELEKKDDALVYLRQFLEIEAYHPQVLDLAVALFEEKNEWEEAAKYLKNYLQVAESKDKLCDIHTRLARVHHYGLMDFNQASTYYFKALETRPDRKEIWKHLFMLYKSTKEYSKALKAMSKYLNLEKDSRQKALNYLELGNIYENVLSQPSKAKKAFLEAVKISKGSIETVKRLVEYFNNQNDKVGKNINLDKLITIQRKKTVEELDVENLLKISHYYHFKGDKVFAGIMAALASDLGSSQDKHSIKPVRRNLPFKAFSNSKLFSYLFANRQSITLNKLFHLFKDNIPEAMASHLAAKIPSDAVEIEDLPESLTALSNKIAAEHQFFVYSGKETIYLPLPTRAIIIPQKFLDNKDQKLLLASTGPFKVFEDTGLSLPHILSRKELLHLLAALCKKLLPSRKLKIKLEPELQDKAAKWADDLVPAGKEKIASSFLIELEKIEAKLVSSCKDDLDLLALKIGYLITGSLTPVKKQQISDSLFKKLLGFTLSKEHEKIRHF